MFTTDAHCDTLYHIAVENSALDQCMVNPDKMLEGNVGLQTFAMYINLRRKTQYVQDAEAMFQLYKALPIPTINGLLPNTLPQQPTGILSVEGGELFGSSFDLLERYDDEARIRLITLTWNFENDIATAAAVNDHDGLKPFGFDFLKEMDRRGICADVSHLNIAGFWDVIDKAKCPPVASHSNCRVLCDHRRNLYDDQIKAMIDRNGFIGVNFYSDFLAVDRPATLDDIIENIDHICELGGENIVGFGSDFDGIDVWPEGCGDSRSFPMILDVLKQRGYTDDQLAKIAGLNYWRVLKEAESISER